jgi:hypothetical protein
MTIACVGTPPSGCIGEPTPIERQECMQRRLVLGRDESTRGTGVSEREREQRFLAAHVCSRCRVGSAEGDRVCVETIIGVERSRQL